MLKRLPDFHFLHELVRLPLGLIPWEAGNKDFEEFPVHVGPDNTVR
jgi:hypothetical protein